jgi:phosphoserine phosphatase
LRRSSVAVFLVSGGFHEFIDPVAKLLEIPVHRVFANRYGLFKGIGGVFQGDSMDCLKYS